MGTRCLAHIKNEAGATLVTIYRQFDGYPTGFGDDLLSHLNGGNIEVVNGYGTNHKHPEVFNGMGCLAAYLIGALKCGIGNVYIYPPDASDCWEEYTYTIYINNGIVRLKVNDLFDGPLSEFSPKQVEESEYED